jgi:predicted DNA-binding protein
MPIIKRRPKENLKPISFRLPEPLLERLSAFADFLNVPQADIVIAALNHVMDSDKEFATAVKPESSGKARKDSHADESKK